MICHKVLNLLDRTPPLQTRRNHPHWRRLRTVVETRAVRTMPDRRFMERQILPAVGRAGFSRVLFVGCADYTRHYRDWFRRTGAAYWTMDVDPAAAAGEDAARHVICDILQAERHLPVRNFDLIIFNGVFGYGVNDPADMARVFVVLHGLLAPSGLLLVGWNRDLVPDPTQFDACRQRFDRAAPFSLPSRTSFDIRQHVIDFLVRKDLAPSDRPP